MTGWTILQIIQGSVKHFEFSRTMIIINAIMVTFADFLLRCSWVHQTGFILHPSTNQLLNKHLNSYGFSIHPISCLLKISSWNKFHIIPGALVVSRLLWALMNTDILQKKKIFLSMPYRHALRTNPKFWESLIKLKQLKLIFVPVRIAGHMT